MDYNCVQLSDLVPATWNCTRLKCVIFYDLIGELIHKSLLLWIHMTVVCIYIYLLKKILKE